MLKVYSLVGRYDGTLALFIVLTSIFALGTAPYLVMVTRPAWYRARSEQLLAGTRWGQGLLALATLVLGGLRAAATQCMPDLYQRHSTAALWAFGVVPLLQQPLLRWQAVAGAAEMAQAGTMLVHIAASQGLLGSWGRVAGLLATIAGYECLTWVLVAALDVRMRLRFLAAQQQQQQPPQQQQDAAL